MLGEAEDQRVNFFFHVIKALKAMGLPYETALSKAAEFILAMYGHVAMRDFCTKSTLARLKFQDPLPFAAAIEAMCETNPMEALKYFKSFPGVWLSLCPKLPITLIEHDSLPLDELFALLDHHDPVNRVPPSSRATMTNTLSSLRVDLIHLIAYAYANQSSHPTRTRFRNVYFCYLYLRDRQAPLQPLLAKALVRAAVTAPLENNEWVSTKKLAWVLRFVRALEGAAVADRLDRLVWRWRGAVINEARRRWDAAGLNRRRGVSTVADVRRAGLFDHDFPRAHRKVAPPAALLASECAPTARLGAGGGGGGRVWGRLGRGVGGRDGARRPYSPFSETRWRSVRIGCAGL
ncbi:fungal specific transcription factor domain containing protein [Neofusicoccum parvum]|uniref:Fungal specific transcription factor domain containing protein n=1 Tax=Neofusicoccum parvum TaxID=310453 RepID=A0ACB5RNG0_9PEZI|nr:fungal specific transcription factor domain containing protein [Neofusicoccum parvum]